jgi:hypothetical protein
MKKTLISLATASLIASTAMAADKGVDFTTTGQAVLYYQTNDSVDFLSKDSSNANVGIQLNLDSDLGNGFAFGSQLTYLGTAGLEKNLVNNTMQNTNGVAGAVNQQGIDDVLALTKINIAKKIGNTTVKIGRQELPKSLSPLAFSEGWNVFKNTFEAVLIVNSDIPDTTVVAAYVGKSNQHGDLSTFGDLTPKAGDAGTVAVDGATVGGTAYMLTVQNTSLPMTTLTASYYAMNKVMADVPALAAAPVNVSGADAAWIDVKVADKSLPMGLNVGIQAGMIMTDNAYLDDTTAFGVQVGAKPMDALSLSAMFTSVDGTDDKSNVAFKNVGTGTKTPLYTQMVANQDAIALDGDTIGLSAAYSMGDAGTVILRGTQTSAGVSNLKGDDFTDLELLYKVKAGGVNFLAAFVNTEVDNGSDAVNIVRVWARYAF